MRMAGGRMKSVEEMGMKGDEVVEEGRERAGVGGQGHSERVAESEQAGNVAADSATAEKPGSPEQPAWPGRWLRQINEAGLSLLTGVPTEETMLRKIAERIGPLENLIYGELFDVISHPKPINVAYTTVELDFHMDLMYYESPPGLQFLHCLKFDECVEGGESRFLDVFQVAEEFRETHPDHFSTLVNVPATFQKIHYERDYPVEMKYQRPHIVLNPYQEIVCVNWSPQFEGPLAVPQDQLKQYYAAYEAFAKAIKFSPHILEQRLNPGDLVTFNNRRILHARQSFELNGGVRHLKGCYLNIDHFKSQVNVYSRLHGEGKPAKRVGNQDWF
ncbi:hypothetical protein ACOMHN_051457 [Nucella lapillus]